jgi:hypothetical protein
MEDLFENGLPRSSTNRLDYSMPTCGPLEFPTQDLPVPPYLFGIWFRKTSYKGNYWVYHDNLEFFKSKLQDSGYEMILKEDRSKKDKALYSISPTVESHLIPNIPTTIPYNYLYASVEQRLDLLSGLVMGKPLQFSKDRSMIYISLTSYLEFRKVQMLAESLGCKTSFKIDPMTKVYRLKFKINYKIHPQQDEPKRKIHQARRYPNTIEEVEPRMCVHIETDSADGSYLVAEGFLTCR